MGVIAQPAASWRWMIAAALWGGAEATCFFIVPDVLLTAAVIALGFLRAWRLAFAAAAGAVLGGMMMWAWGAHDADGARAFLLAVPLVGDDLLVRVAREMSGAGSWPWPISLAAGALTGAPFKIYAVEAGALGLHPLAFALAGFAARLARFMLAIGLTALGLAIARKTGLMRWPPLARLGAPKRLESAVLALVWCVIYGVYVTARLNV